MTVKHFLILSLLGLLFTTTVAQTALYGPEAPQNASYVRVVNATPEPLQEVRLGQIMLDPLEPAEVSAYTMLEPGEHGVRVDEHSGVLTLVPESFTTVVVFAAGLQVYDDEALRDITRGLLTVYNFTPEPLSLHTENGQEVFGAVAPLGSESVSINEVNVGFQVKVGEQVLTVDARRYARGNAHGLFVFAGEDEPVVAYVRATP